MIDYSNINLMFDVVEEDRAKESEASGYKVLGVSDEEKIQAQKWADGCELKQIVDTTGFQLLLAKLEKYVEDSIKDLVMGTDPTETDKILRRHAVAHAAHSLRERLINEIRSDLLAAEESPEIIKQGLRLSRQSPVGT